MDAPIVDATATESEVEAERSYGRPEKQAAILDAATEVFLREGYDHASVDTIAAVANVSKRTIYNHFGDKKELFLAAMERSRARADYSGAITDEVFEPDPSKPINERLITLGKNVLHRYLEPEQASFRRVALAEIFRYPELKMACMEATSPRAMRSRFVERIEQGIRDGVVEVPDPLMAAEQYFALLMYGLNYASAWGTVDLTDDQVTEIATAAADNFLRAYLKR